MGVVNLDYVCMFHHRLSIIFYFFIYVKPNLDSRESIKKVWVVALNWSESSIFGLCV